MMDKEEFIRLFEKHLIFVDYDDADTHYATYAFEFEHIYRIIILNKQGTNKWEIEISISNFDKQRAPVYSKIQEITVFDVKDVYKILTKVKKASKHPERYVFDFSK